MANVTTSGYSKPVMDGVIQICKCMKNVFVQCELWCDEILRRVARPCCTCSRHVSAQALEDLAPAQRLRISPGSSRAFAPGLEISLTQCPVDQSKLAKRAEKPQSYPCPASKPTSGCGQTTMSYLMYSTACSKRFGVSPTRLPPKSPHESFSTQAIRSPLSKSPSFSTEGSLLLDLHKENYQILRRQDDRAEFGTDDGSESSTPGSYYTPPSSNSAMSNEPTSTYWQTPTTMYAEVHTGTSMQGRSSLVDSVPRRISHAKSGYSSPGAPIISTDQMADWHAMMVSLMWNVQAWRDWIQENIDRALAYAPDTNISQGEVDESWSSFQRKITTESLQWRQYNTFSRQLTMRLAFRYKDKQIVSPTRASDKTDDYMACQREMLEIIDMFNRWTQWLTVVVKEADAVKEIPESDTPINVLRWSYFKRKVEEYSDDWTKYNIHLKVAWEQKYRTLIAEWLPPWSQRGPVWVVSACGAVPSGAVAAGLFDAEVIWVARTTHRCNVLPAALHPSKHCCLVYSDGAVHHYTKYQVMCNAEVRWVAWRAGAADPRAVRVAAGVHVGRVLYRGSHLLGAVHAPHYRCHVVIFERPFAFNCYELLVLADGDY
ncbi:hypothetical protein K1T71_002061 [Dendrolimus kikuchii]|uniref:Uncharacterized protein n=1 Tax=Dendrolimus kikuchii TaxID=765133 RepID=A0ACC1DGZ3_9NEOP|nr:hypothetical protein K1T71_002061 [Dendrolimus kikuchii]